MAAGSTSIAPPMTTLTTYDEVRHAGARWASTAPRSLGCPALWHPRPRHGLGTCAAARARRLGGTRHRRAGRHGATALLVAGLTLRREATGDHRFDAVLARLGASWSWQTETSGAVRRRMTPRAGGRCPARTRSTSPARRTGRWRACTSRFRPRAGARRRTASAPTSPARVTTSRATPRRSPITGPPTACLRPSASASAVTRR